MGAKDGAVMANLVFTQVSAVDGEAYLIYWQRLGTTNTTTSDPHGGDRARVELASAATRLEHGGR